MSHASLEGGDLPGSPSFFHDQENSGDGTKKEQRNKYGVEVA